MRGEIYRGTFCQFLRHQKSLHRKSNRTHLKNTSSPRCERFSRIRKARRGSCSAVATATEPQRSGTGKSPQPLRDMTNFRNTGVASDSECIKHTFVLAPWSCGNWLISRAEVFLRWVLVPHRKILALADSGEPAGHADCCKSE